MYKYLCYVLFMYSHYWFMSSTLQDECPYTFSGSTNSPSLCSLQPSASKFYFSLHSHYLSVCIYVYIRTPFYNV